MSGSVSTAPAGVWSRGRESLSLGVLALGAAAAVTLVATVDPNEAGHYPTCPFLAVTGLFCPGCGSMRAVHALAYGDVAAAVLLNPFAVAAAAYLLAWWVTRLVRLTGRSAPSLSTSRPGFVWVLMGLLVVFGVLRNLPGLDWLAPA